MQPIKKSVSKGALSRIEALEERVDDLQKTLISVVSSFNQTVSQLTNGLDAHEEMMGAIVEVVGEEKVAQAIADRRIRAVQEEEKQTRDWIHKALEEGQLEPAEAVEQNTFVVGVEYNAEGVQKTPIVAVQFSSVQKQFQDLVLGKKPSESVDLPNGERFEIQEVYRIVPQPESVAPEPEAIDEPEVDVSEAVDAEVED